MKLVVWSKTILSVYRYLGTITEAVDNLVFKQGINSNLSTFSESNSTFNCANRIIELTERKIKLINLKVIIEDCMAKLKRDEMRLLVLFYFDMVKAREVARIMDISIRTFFRKKSIALKNFASNLSGVGCNEAKIDDYLNTENWLKNAYIMQLNKKEKDFCEDNNINDYKLIKYILKDLNKVTTTSYYNYV